MQSQHRAIEIGDGDGHPRARTGWKTNDGARQLRRGDGLIDDRGHIVLRKSGRSAHGPHQITLRRQSSRQRSNNECPCCGPRPNPAGSSRLVHEGQGNAADDHHSGRRKLGHGWQKTGLRRAGESGKLGDIAADVLTTPTPPTAARS